MENTGLAHDPYHDGCAYDTKYKENAKREFGQQNVAKETECYLLAYLSMK